MSVLPPDELLAPYQNLINQIKENVGVPVAHWNDVYYEFIENFASKVQLLPASESHHHASFGGLLQHSLEAGLNALKLRRALMLPLGGDSETIEKEKELWSYAVFTAALLHDVGKPLTDQIITIVNDSKHRTFNPLTESFNLSQVYRLEFRRGRKYRSHENVPLLLASRLIPDIGLNWLCSNPDILDEWTFCLTGRKSEAESIGDLITKADQISTAQSLTGSELVATPAAKVTPLHKRLKTALVYLVDNEVIPLNRQGAAAWVFDKKLWCVSKRVIDEIRSLMREEGQTGIPSDNSRIMDELMQHGVITPNDDLAIWKMNVSVGSWVNRFTLLCFPLKNLWDDESAWPPSLDQIQITEADSNSGNAENSNKPEMTNEAIETTICESEVTEKPKAAESNDDTEAGLDLPLPPGITPKTAVESEPMGEVDEASNDDKPNDSKPIKGDSTEKFVNWLSNGIADGTISINQAQAMAHTIGENKDLILVSPKIFREFASKRNLEYTQVQRDFQQLGFHTIKDDKNVMSFKTLTKRANKDSGHLTGMLIENAETKFGIRLPPANSHIDYKD